MQFNSFILGDKEASKRADDLLDGAVLCGERRLPRAADEEGR
jgi:hypothetical protein